MSSTPIELELEINLYMEDILKISLFGFFLIVHSFFLNMSMNFMHTYENWRSDYDSVELCLVKNVYIYKGDTVNS